VSECGGGARGVAESGGERAREREREPKRTIGKLGQPQSPVSRNPHTWEVGIRAPREHGIMLDAPPTDWIRPVLPNGPSLATASEIRRAVGST
jgi:hypothetical protein